MYQYRITIWFDEETKSWNDLDTDTEAFDITRGQPLTEREAEDIIKNTVRALGLDGSGELSWDIAEIKEVMNGKVKY